MPQTNSDTEGEKCSYLLIWVGEKGRDIYNTWTDFTDENQNKLKTCNMKFEICKAKGQKCHKCVKYNHFARQCKTGEVATVKITDAPSETESDDEFYIETVSSTVRCRSFAT